MNRGRGYFGNSKRGRSDYQGDRENRSSFLQQLRSCGQDALTNVKETPSSDEEAVKQVVARLMNSLASAIRHRIFTMTGKPSKADNDVLDSFGKAVTEQKICQEWQDCIMNRLNVEITSLWKNFMNLKLEALVATTATEFVKLRDLVVNNRELDFDAALKTGWKEASERNSEWDLQAEVIYNSTTWPRILRDESVAKVRLEKSEIATALAGLRGFDWTANPDKDGCEFFLMVLRRIDCLLYEHVKKNMATKPAEPGK